MIDYRISRRNSHTLYKKGFIHRIKSSNHLTQHNKQYHMKVFLNSFCVNGHTETKYCSTILVTYILEFKISIESQLTRNILHLTKLWKGGQKHKTHLQGNFLRIMTAQFHARLVQGLKTHLNLSPQSKQQGKHFLFSNLSLEKLLKPLCSMPGLGVGDCHIKRTSTPLDKPPPPPASLSYGSPPRGWGGGWLHWGLVKDQTTGFSFLTKLLASFSRKYWR